MKIYVCFITYKIKLLHGYDFLCVLLMIAIFFSKIRRDETIRMIYVLPEMDKNFQRYLASNTPKIGFFKIMAGRKEAGSN